MDRDVHQDNQVIADISAAQEILAEAAAIITGAIKSGVEDISTNAKDTESLINKAIAILTDVKQRLKSGGI